MAIRSHKLNLNSIIDSLSIELSSVQLLCNWNSPWLMNIFDMQSIKYTESNFT